MKPNINILNVLLHDKVIGTLVRLQDDRNIFSLNSDYINNPNRPTLSLSFKGVLGELITDFRPTQTRVPTFFANLLPEGQLREYLAQRANVKPQREFFLLWVLGQDLPGAVKIVPTDEESWQSETEESIPEIVNGKKDNKEGVLRFSLAGVQLKFSAINEATGGLTIPVDGVGGSWIVKLPSTKFNGIPENEFTMMEFARRIGIDVPETKLVPIHEISGLPKNIETFGESAFAIRRFDRQENGERIHIEDFAQIFRVYPNDKYTSASYRNIADVIRTETGEEGITEFIRRFVFNLLIGNADMHLKNWSLTYPDKINAKLAPAYDFLSTIPYLNEDSLALNFLNSKAFDSINIDSFKRFAAKAYLSEKLVLDTVRETVESFDDVWHSAKDLPLDNKIRRAINAHLNTLSLRKSI